MKRILSFILIIGMFTGSFVYASATGFSDIQDNEIQREAETLQMMDVISGMPDGTFQPQGILTRAQFCKMAVAVMGKANAVGQYQSYTIFPDVRASYWASGFINLAVCGDTKLIAGYANGNFAPEDPITYGQAVTILMRLLGYTDSDAGVVWPDGYLAAAASTGLTDGLSLKGSDHLTRGQSVKLFYNLLTTDLKDGSCTYIESQSGKLVKDVILLSTDAEADDGTEGAVETTSGTYKTAKKDMPDMFEGQKGTLVLDKNEKVLTFLTDTEEKSQTITVSQAESDCLLDVAGKEYKVKTDTVVYDDGDKTTYAEIYKNVRTGSVATLYYQASGTVDYVFFSGKAAKEAAVIPRDKTLGGISALTEGNTSYKLYKDGIPASVTDMRKYDVAIYDQTAGIVYVTDNKLSGCYENVYPNREAPQTVTIMGVDFPVLPSAASSFTDCKLGDIITLLLTSDNQVAGVLKSEVSSNAYGIVTKASDTSAEVQLFSGLTVSGNAYLSEKSAEKMVGQLVKVSSNKVGHIVLGRVDNNRNVSDFQVSTRMIGNKQLADNVRIFDKVGKSKLTELTLSDLTQEKVSSSQIDYTALDYAGRVQILVLEDATGECYTYGRFVVKGQKEYDSDGDEYIARSICVEYDNDKITDPVSSNGKYQSDVFGGLVASADGGTVAKSVTLKKLSKVPNSAWDEKEKTVTVNGVVYPVSDDVHCYNSTTKKWLTLKAAKAFSATADLYYDRDPGQGGKIRIVEIHQ